MSSNVDKLVEYGHEVVNLVIANLAGDNGMGAALQTEMVFVVLFLALVVLVTSRL
ncbi:MAG: hypothetical protein H6851_06460 [Geminicoccaceae bacterium]|nr:hypothetical protein [Geminicoccaceae bacterium]MCB9943249.1 hypothetical protein [Geminicoccaceae bacterium]